MQDCSCSRGGSAMFCECQTTRTVKPFEIKLNERNYQRAFGTIAMFWAFPRHVDYDGKPRNGLEALVLPF